MATTASLSSPLPLSPNSHNKRKRGLSDQEFGRNMKAATSNGDNSQVHAETNYAALLQGITDPMVGQDENTRTAQAALAAPMSTSQYPEPSPFESTSLPPGFDDQGTPGGQQQPMAPGAQALFDARQQTSKPAVGSTAWHQLRKDNHKEVERRRREVINEGIENIAKVVPGTEKNKGAILQRTCQYIAELQAKIAAFDNERALFNGTQAELTNRNDRLRDSAQRAWQETAKWQQRCRDAGLQFEDYDAGPGADLEDDSVLDPNALPS